MGRRTIRVLRLLGCIERVAGVRGRRCRHELRVGERSAMRADLVVDRLPPHVRDLLGTVGTTSRTLPVHSHSVRLGRFDRHGQARARAFLLDGAGTTIKLQRHVRGHGLDREVAARRLVHHRFPELAPRLVDDGDVRGRGTRWMLEELVVGAHPASASAVTALAPCLLARLGRWYAMAGVTTRLLHTQLDRRTLERWCAAVAAVPALRAVDVRVRELLAADPGVDVGLAHGDLVASNVLVREDGAPVLVDWEHAGRRPLADDVAKVVLQASDPWAALDASRANLGHLVGRRRDAAPLEVQIALTHVRMFSWYEHRRAKAEAVGRIESFERDVARRSDQLRKLLDA